MENKSEIAALRENIRLSYEAAKRALHDPAFGAAKHQFITKRMENIQQNHEKLRTLIGEREAIKILAQTLENIPEERSTPIGPCHKENTI